MPKPARPSARRTIAADPTSAALTKLAEIALDRHFADLDNRDAYEFLFPSGSKRRNRASVAQGTSLDVWEMPGGGMLVLMAAPGRHLFAVMLDHEPIGAIVIATYDPAEGKLKSATVEQMVGKKTAILAAACAWTENLIRGDFLRSQSDPDDPAGGLDDTEAPGAPTEQDAATVRQIAETLATMLASPDPPNADSPDREWLEDNPQTLWVILTGLVAACRAADRDPALVDAYRFLLVTQLEQIRYRLEIGYAWAGQMLDTYQDGLVALSKDRLLAHDDLLRLAATLTEAKIAVRPALSKALMNAGAEATVDPATLANPLESLRDMLDQLAEQVDSPFEVIEGLAGVTGTAPAELRGFIAHEFALSVHPLLRDAVPLMLLDEAAEIRQSAMAALEQTATAETFSPAALRRTIAVRNWIPEADRAGLDRVIRAARAKGVVCAQWAPSPELMVLASSIDGSGTQSVIATTRTGPTGIFCGVLLKQGFGIRDTWCDGQKPRRDINAMLAELRRRTPATEVDPAYIALAVQHHIAIGLAQARVPAPALLDIAERTGGNDWQDRRIDVAAETELLFAGLAPTERSQAGIAASLRRSGNWLAREDFASSWFEDNAEIRRMARGQSTDRAKTLQMVLAEELPKHRFVWAERFLLMALWARAAKDRVRNGRMRDFVILAHQLFSDTPLADIPLMVGIAEYSIRVARSRR